MSYVLLILQRLEAQQRSEVLVRTRIIFALVLYAFAAGHPTLRGNLDTEQCWCHLKIWRHLIPGTARTHKHQHRHLPFKTISYHRCQRCSMGVIAQGTLESKSCICNNLASPAMCAGRESGRGCKQRCLFQDTPRYKSTN